MLSKGIVAAAKKAGGLLTAQDLAAYQVVAREPLRGKALGFEWATAPLPSAGGYTILESLLLLEKAVQEKREALLAAAKEKKALEVFKEKKMRDLRMEQLNRERAFLDEIAVQGRGHK